MLINWFTGIFTCTPIKKLVNFVVIVSTLYVHWLEKKSIYEMILISPDFFWLTVLWIFYWFRNMKYMYMNSYSELVLSVALIRGIRNFFFLVVFFIYQICVHPVWTLTWINAIWLVNTDLISLLISTKSVHNTAMFFSLWNWVSVVKTIYFYNTGLCFSLVKSLRSKRICSGYQIFMSIN